MLWHRRRYWKGIVWHIIFKCHNSGETKYQVVTTNPFILIFLQRFECSCTHFQAINSVNSQKRHLYQCKNTVTKNNKIQLIIMDIIQSYYTLSNKNNGAELMFLFNIDLSHLINKLSLISNKNSLVPWIRMVKSSNEGSWLQNKGGHVLNSWLTAHLF